MTEQTRVFLHAGAHRTGTSSFQACLSVNRARLAEAGFDAAYPGRDGIADGALALRLPHPRHRRTPDAEWAAAAGAELARHLSAPGRDLVLSEENIPGRMFHFYQGQFYPAAKRRAGVLAAALPGRVEHLLFVIRPYEAMFISAYRKRAEDNPVAPFADLRDRMAAMDRGWPEILTILRRRLKPARMTVIEYAARGRSRDLLERLLPEGAVTGLEEPERQLNLSATDAGLIALQALYRSGETLPREAWQQVIADHAGDREARGFAAFTPEQTAALRDRYAADLDRIRAMERMRFVE